ncbi:transmembrane protease serine 9-like [Bicyclus anynana]|uniref:Transmembrane protease serine 9-like n=1 Tax=Bicyclus anynana TaxID=110368 RepID=A0ABM3LGD3_BICAN|nr:transmembrane protease serine 9-like [Bicyclus anynana]
MTPYRIALTNLRDERHLFYETYDEHKSTSHPVTLPDYIVSRRHGHRSKSHGNKIVGGYDTTIQDFPYQAYLLLQKGSDYYQCGGSIISDSYILTAAHCLSGVSKVFARVGSTDADSGGTQYKSTHFKAHPKYNPGTLDYDVGLIHFSNKINLDGENAKAIQLAESGSSVPPDTTLTVSGWGATSENGDVSPTLMAVQVPTVSTEECNNSYGDITVRMICAGVPEGGKDSCQGDSGGPAVGDGPIQLGIVSFGVGCARPGYPGVYSNVSALRNWIRKNSGQEKILSLELGSWRSWLESCLPPTVPSDYENVESSVPDNSTKRFHDDHYIVGGYNVTIQEFPYQAYLLLKKGRQYYQCGGSIISNRYILTAAHCLTRVSKVIARVGSSEADSGGTQYTSREFKIHPRYDRSTFDYDVGYVRFENIFIDEVNTAIVTLAESGTRVRPGTYLTVTGWGATEEDGDTSENLMAVQVPVVSNARCRQSYDTITSRMICAGDEEGGRDSCGGDSGGPGVTDDRVQRAIVSNGIGCARPGIPGVYTNVASVREWIRRNTGV